MHNKKCDDVSTVDDITIWMTSFWRENGVLFFDRYKNFFRPREKKKRRRRRRRRRRTDTDENACGVTQQPRHQQQ